MPGDDQSVLKLWLGDPRVLVADDEPDVAAAHASLLRSCDCEPLVAPDGTDALPLLAANDDIDAALLDVYMPQLGGLELARQLRQAGSKMPILLVTVGSLGSNRPLVNVARRSGCGTAFKPLDKDDLCGFLKDVVEPSPHHRRCQLRRLARRAHLPAGQIDVLWYLLHGAARDETAVLLGISPSTVKVQRERLHKALRAVGAPSPERLRCMLMWERPPPFRLPL
ncbi:MAG: response regulator [Deltaproteobacteria bacterium]|nr:response regulator [Deltaproteobacteria bacterium]